MSVADKVPVAVADVKVIIGILANVEAHLMDAREGDAIRHLFERLHLDLTRHGQASADDDSAAVAAITQRLHEALGDGVSNRQ
jgi:hypothetical protein